MLSVIHFIRLFSFNLSPAFLPHPFYFSVLSSFFSPSIFPSIQVNISQEHAVTEQQLKLLAVMRYVSVFSKVPALKFVIIA
jgi:hypothetical protein